MIKFTYEKKVTRNLKNISYQGKLDRGLHDKEQLENLFYQVRYDIGIPF